MPKEELGLNKGSLVVCKINADDPQEEGETVGGPDAVAWSQGCVSMVKLEALSAEGVV